MAKRSKPKVEIIEDLKQAEAALEQLAGWSRELTAIETEMNAAIDAAKKKAAEKAGPITLAITQKEAALALFAQTNEDKYFKKPKSRKLAFGTIGFRQSTVLKTLPKVKMATVLEKLKNLGFKEAIKTNETVDKEAMREWPEERLKSVGMRRQKPNVFFIELDQETLTAGNG